MEERQDAHAAAGWEMMEYSCEENNKSLWEAGLKCRNTNPKDCTMTRL